MEMNGKLKALPLSELHRRCNLADFNFESTADLEPLEVVVGQDRAVKAVSFGIDIQSPGYHMYALGPSGTGKTTTIKKFLERKCIDQPIPDDWLYVNNFENPDKPCALRLPAGKGCEFKEDMERLVSDLETEIPNAFESEDYDKEQEAVEQKFQERRQEHFNELEKKARDQDFRLLQTPRGIILAPVVDGDVISNEQFNNLDAEKQDEIESNQKKLREEMRDTLHQIQGFKTCDDDRDLVLERDVQDVAQGDRADIRGIRTHRVVPGPSALRERPWSAGFRS